MARRRLADLSRTFRKDPLLQEFYLDGILPAGETLGVGSYGSVVEVSSEIVKLAIAIYMNPGRRVGGGKKDTAWYALLHMPNRGIPLIFGKLFQYSLEFLLANI